MYLRSCLVVLGLALATFSSPTKRDVPTIEADLTDIDMQVDSLDSAIIALPDSRATMAQVMAIAQSASMLDNALQTATIDTSSITSFTEAEGSTIVNHLMDITSDTKKTLTHLVNKHPTFVGLPGTTALVQQVLWELESNSDSLFLVLFDKLPADLVSDAREQKTLVDDAFSSAISMYSS